MDLAFHYDEQYRDVWAHLAQAYRCRVWEVGTPEGLAGPWTPVETLDDVFCLRRVFFNPKTAKYSPGTVSLRDYAPIANDTDVLCFGSDHQHNRFNPRADDLLVYIPTPHRSPLWAFQAAHVALWEVTRGNH